MRLHLQVLLGHQRPPQELCLPLPALRRGGWGAPEIWLSHPPALRLGAPFGGGWVGIPPELPQWRPMCFGSHATSNNRATSAAMGLFQAAPGLCKRPLAAAPFAQELAMPAPMHRGRWCSAPGKAPPTRPCWCQSTLAASVSLEAIRLGVREEVALPERLAEPGTLLQPGGAAQRVIRVPEGVVGVRPPVRKASSTAARGYKLSRESSTSRHQASRRRSRRTGIPTLRGAGAAPSRRAQGLEEVFELEHEAEGKRNAPEGHLLA